jgi:hypothetical protein
MKWWDKEPLAIRLEQEEDFREDVSMSTLFNRPSNESEIFSDRQLAIIQYCAAEVGRQYAYPSAPAQHSANAVYWMIQAWEWAAWRRREQGNLDVAVIERLGQLVEPEKNQEGFRTCTVYVGSYQCPPPDQVRQLARNWITFVNSTTTSGADQHAQTCYVSFEEIHPFTDGNGRVGKIIYNWIRGTLDDPKMPLNVWGISNP